MVRRVITRVLCRNFHDYWTQTTKEGQQFRIPLMKAKQHLGTFTSRGTRRENEDRIKFGFLNQLSADHQRFYFAVVDGHGGAHCGDFLESKLHSYIEEAQAKDAEDIVEKWRERVGGYFRRFRPHALESVAAEQALTLEQRLTIAFLQADYAFYTDYDTNEKSGAVASVALVTAKDTLPFWESRNAMVHVAHVGDTRILLCETETGLASALTHNHHPSSTTESERLRRYASGFAIDSFGEERFGFLANTRAFGDRPMKKLGVSAEPEVTQVSLGDGNFAFMVLCTDGVTSVLSDQEIVDVVKEGGAFPNDAAKSIVRLAEELGTQDNASCIVIRLSGWGKDMPDLTKDMRDYRKAESAQSGPRRR